MPEYGKFHTTKAQAKSKNLPEAEIFVDATGSGMSGVQFADARTYLRLSGPPGGPFGLRIEGFKDSVHDARELAAFLKKEHGSSAGFLLGGREAVKLAGETREAILYKMYESEARTAYCAVIITAAQNKSSRESILITFEIGDLRIENCSDLLNESKFQTILKHIAVKF